MVNGIYVQKNRTINNNLAINIYQDDKYLASFFMKSEIDNSKEDLLEIDFLSNIYEKCRAKERRETFLDPNRKKIKLIVTATRGGIRGNQKGLFDKMIESMEESNKNIHSHITPVKYCGQNLLNFYSFLKN